MTDGVAGPGLVRALWRGITIRCPRCGGGGLFRGWLAMKQDCPTCDLHFERVDGYWLGSMALNLVVTEGFFIAALVGLLVATWPDVPWTRVLVALVAINVLVPLLFHPPSRTLWMGIERRLSGEWD